MGIEVDLLRNYPRAKREVKKRGSHKTQEDRQIAQKFGKEFFDGDRTVGYGGFHYHPRFWQNVIPDFINHWNLTKNDHILDVGCAKGFMLYDFFKSIEGINLTGIDISEYAIANSISQIRNRLSVASCHNLPFDDNSFDYTVSITTIHNMDYDGCVKALKEIERVSRKGSFITVDAYRNKVERQRMLDWNLTAKTILHVDEWKTMFEKAGFTGDYYWFIP